MTRLERIGPLIVSAVVAVVAVVGIGASIAQAGPNSGLRILTVTSRNDATAEKHVDKFFVAPGDRVYVTRIEAEVIHPDGSVAGVDFAAGFKFGNMTLSKVQP